MDANKNDPAETGFHGRPTIDHSKRIQLALAGTSLAVILVLLTFEQSLPVRFAICCFAVTLPISAVFAAKFEVDDPASWFKPRWYPKFLYGFNLLLFGLGLAAVFASGSALYLVLFVLGGMLAGGLWQHKPKSKQLTTANDDTAKNQQSKAA